MFGQYYQGIDEFGFNCDESMDFILNSDYYSQRNIIQDDCMNDLDLSNPEEIREAKNDGNLVYGFYVENDKLFIQCTFEQYQMIKKEMQKRISSQKTLCDITEAPLENNKKN